MGSGALTSAVRGVTVGTRRIGAIRPLDVRQDETVCKSNRKWQVPSYGTQKSDQLLMAAYFQRRRFELLGASLIVAAVAATFAGIVGHRFLENWDDEMIYANPHLRAFTWENLRWAFTDLNAHPRHIYMPLSWVWWTLVNQTAGLTPTVYHGINLVVHSANAVLVFLLVRKFLLRLRPELAVEPGAGQSWRPGGPAASNFWLALVSGGAALGWALHPLRVEPVAWAITQKFLLATLLVLLSLFCQLRRLEGLGGNSWMMNGWYWLSWLLFGASVLFYPVAVAWPGVMAVVEYAWPRTGLAEPRARRLRGAVGAAAPFLVLSLVVISVPLFLAPPAPMEEAGTLRSASSAWIAQPMEAAYVWMYFAWKPLVPTGLFPIYTTLLRINPWSFPFVASLLGLVATTALLVAQRRRWPWALALWLCHLVLLVPVLGLGVSTENYPSDRYAYLQGIGWALLTGVLLAHLTWDRPQWVRLTWLLPGGCVLAALAAASVRQAVIWTDNVTFYERLLQAPHIDDFRFDLHWRLATYHMDKGAFGAARTVLEQAVKIKPQDDVSWGLLAVANEASGDLAPAEQCARRAAEIQPRAAMWRLLARICVRAGKPAAAISALEQAAEREPGNVETHLLLAVLLADGGRLHQSLAELNRVLALDPGHAQARNLRATLLQRMAAQGR